MQMISCDLWIPLLLMYLSIVLRLSLFIPFLMSVFSVGSSLSCTAFLRISGHAFALKFDTNQGDGDMLFELETNLDSDGGSSD